MRLPVLAVCIFVLLASFGDIAVGQNQSDEFIESSSPLPGGGRVVSRSTPDTGIQTVAADAPSSVLESSRSSLDRRDADSERSSVFRQAAPANATGQQQRYPYPTNANANASASASAPRVAQAGLFQPPVRASRTCTNCAVPFQVPTLGLSGTQTAARQVYGTGNCCTPQLGPTTSLQVPALQAPVLQLQPPASQVPSLAVPSLSVPQTGVFNQGFQTGFQQPAGFQQQPLTTNPNLGVPQFGAGRSSSFLTPFVTGSGVYQPIIRLANLRPGTYLGQGIIGQPTAYVDGQPVRNLLRYVFP